MSLRWIPILGMLALLATTDSAIAARKTTGVVELQVGQARHLGRVAARTSRHCWLQDRTGRITALKLSDVTSFKQVSSRFSPFTVTMLNSQLTRELGRGFEVKTTRHYVVAAPRGRARNYAELFENMYRTFYMHFSVRGMRFQEPEFPMVAIIFPDRAQFASYARAEGVQAQSGLLGYYMPYSNRVALFESRSRQAELPVGSGLRLLNQSSTVVGFVDELDGAEDESFATVRAGLRDTMIHESTHQIAFNVGLHARIGENPKWIVEGLATVFEPDGIRESSKGRSIQNRINRERYVWFRNYISTRRKPDSLAAFVQSDDLFRSDTLDAYAEAWALSFFLFETRPRNYAAFLKKMTTRDHMTKLTKQERLRTFSTSFGGNTKLLEAEFLRFFKRLD